jgi:hypothetical protein
MNTFSDHSVIDSDDEAPHAYYRNYFESKRAAMENESDNESENVIDNANNNDIRRTITFPPPSPTNPYKINFPVNWFHEDNNDANNANDTNDANDANDDNDDDDANDANNVNSPVDQRKKILLQREFDLLQASYRKRQSIKSFRTMKKAIEAMKARQPCRSKFGIGIFAHERPKKKTPTKLNWSRST